MGEKQFVSCKYFNGTVHQTCDAGIDYDTVKESNVRPFRWPCLHNDLPCEKREYPTAEEVETERQANNKMVDDVIMVVNLIRTETGGKRGRQGSVPCPACKAGAVQYSVSSYNGHMSAFCSNPNCNIHFIQ
jgi:hypothetical protein